MFSDSNAAHCLHLLHFKNTVIQISGFQITSKQKNACSYFCKTCNLHKQVEPAMQTRKTVHQIIINKHIKETQNS